MIPLPLLPFNSIFHPLSRATAPSVTGTYDDRLEAKLTLQDLKALETAFMVLLRLFFRFFTKNY